jgi:hypothetical protein
MTLCVKSVGHGILVSVALLLALVALVAVLMFHPTIPSTLFSVGPAQAEQCPSSTTHC